MEHFVTDVTFLHQDDFLLLTDNLRRNGIEIVVMDGTTIHDVSSLWREAVRVLPFPINERLHADYYLDHWQGFADHIRFGLLAQEVPARKALLWTHVENILAGSIQDLCDAIIIFSRLTYSTLTERGINFGIYDYFCTFLLGNEANFPHVLTEETILRLP